MILRKDSYRRYQRRRICPVCSGINISISHDSANGLYFKCNDCAGMWVLSFSGKRANLEKDASEFSEKTRWLFIGAIR